MGILYRLASGACCLQRGEILKKVPLWKLPKSFEVESVKKTKQGGVARARICADQQVWEDTYCIRHRTADVHVCWQLR